ncbi:MAG: hypothetical protein N3A59_00025 [Thermodesulfovibrionales bacterium]|nr:hypothetical protein [Thermodesulfovibrionales bacterium]
MKIKSIIALMVAIIFTMGLVSMAFAAAEVKGTVSKVEGNKVTVKDDKGKETTVEVKDAKDVKVGDKVTIKDGVVKKEAPKKKKPEGC